MHEEFLGFFDCYEESKEIDGFNQSLTGEIIGNIVLKVIERFDLNLDRLVGIATDTCSVMSSTERGAVCQIKKFARFSIHSPCLNHLVNLSTKLICSKPEIDYYLKICQEIYNFFRFPKRNNVLQQNVEGEQKRQLAKLCLTRWTSASSVTTSIIELLGPIMKSLEYFRKTNDSIVRKTSFGLLNQINGAFVAHVLMIDRILGIINPMVIKLQAKNSNLSESHSLINKTIEVISEFEKKRGVFEKIYEKSEQICIKCGIEIKYNRNFDRRANINHYFEVFKETCSYFCKDLESRVTKKEQIMMKIDSLWKHECSEEGILLLSEYFSDFFNLNPLLFSKTLNNEYQIFKKYEKKEDILECIEWANSHFNLIPKILIVLVTIPPSVASAERSFSCLKRLKTWLRTTMEQQRTSGLAQMQLSNEMPTIEEIFTKFAEKSRKFDFIL